MSRVRIRTMLEVDGHDFYRDYEISDPEWRDQWRVPRRPISLDHMTITEFDRALRRRDEAIRRLADLFAHDFAMVLEKHDAENDPR